VIQYNSDADAIAVALNTVIDDIPPEARSYLIETIMQIVFSEKQDKVIKSLDLIRLIFLSSMEKKTIKHINQMEELLKGLAGTMNPEDWYMAHKEIEDLLEKFNETKKHGIFTVYNGGLLSIQGEK